MLRWSQPNQVSHHIDQTTSTRQAIISIFTQINSIKKLRSDCSLTVPVINRFVCVLPIFLKDSFLLFAINNIHTHTHTITLFAVEKPVIFHNYLRLYCPYISDIFATDNGNLSRLPGQRYERNYLCVCFWFKIYAVRTEWKILCVWRQSGRIVTSVSRSCSLNKMLRNRNVYKYNKNTPHTTNSARRFCCIVKPFIAIFVHIYTTISPIYVYRVQRRKKKINNFNGAICSVYMMLR